MAPAALESEVTRREWRAARQSGVAVFPVKGPGFDPAGANVPRWMTKVHCYDLDVQWETFVAHLRRGAQPVRVPFMAPPLPADFVPRPRELDALKRLLLTAEHGDAITITTALSGAGGFGKTTLAVALSHDDDVLTAFDDGVLWTDTRPNAERAGRVHAPLRSYRRAAELRQRGRRGAGFRGEARDPQLPYRRRRRLGRSAPEALLPRRAWLCPPRNHAAGSGRCGSEACRCRRDESGRGSVATGRTAPGASIVGGAVPASCASARRMAAPPQTRGGRDAPAHRTRRQHRGSA